MLNSVKRRLYFIVARYFKLLARIKLKRWSPRIIVVTGSAGKTSLLHLLEAQLGTQAHYSHEANSTFGICFDILGLKGIRNSRLDWLKLAIQAPLALFTKTYPEEFYVAEADVDRPYEGTLLASLLQPEITMWVSSLHTHVVQFEKQVGRKFASVEEAIAAEYGEFAKTTKKLLVINGDNPQMVNQAKNNQAQIVLIKKADRVSYKLSDGGTSFSFDNKVYSLPVLLPEATYYQVAMTDKLLHYLEQEPDYQYKKLHMPPGRSNLLHGIKNTKIIDSTYNNSNFDTLSTVVNMFEAYPAKHKWLVIGDMLEQGTHEAREHAKIAKLLEEKHFERVIFMGPRVIAYALPALSLAFLKRTQIASFDKPVEVYEYLKKELNGGEVILFKAVRFMEGVIEKLLANPEDASKLPRRGRMWDKRRRAWGL